MQLADLQVQLAAVRSRKSATEARLQALLTDSASLLPDVSGDLSEASAGLDSLLYDIRKVVGTAAALSGPVGELEKVKKRAEAVLQRVKDLAKVGDLMQALRAAASAGNLEKAADCVFTLTQISHQLPLDDRTLVDFTRIKESLSTAVKSRFGEALAASNQSEMQASASLIHKLGLSREGIDSYIAFILRDLSQTAGQGFELLQTGQGAGKYEDALVKLFRLVATTLSKHKENLQEKFGTEGVVAFVKGLRREVDLQAVRLYTKFRSDRQVERWEDELKRTKSLSADLTSIDSLCAEVATLIKHSESFENYFRIQTAPLAASLPKRSELKVKLQELVNVYVSFEVHYMSKAISRAVEGIDESDQVANAYKSLEPIRVGAASERIDELFYVLRQSSQRALRTFNLDNICAVLNHIPVHLIEELLEKLQSKSVFLLSKQSLLSPQFQPATAAFVVLVNLLEWSQACIGKLAAELKVDFAAVYGGNAASEQQMFLLCLDSLMKAGDRFKSAGTEAIRKAVESFRGQVVALTATLAAVSYEIAEEQLAEYEVNDPFAQAFSANVKSLMKQWKVQLEPEAGDAFVEAVAACVAEELEKRVRGKRCNELGAVQLEKDIREVTKTLQSLSQRPVRLRFQRLKQITQLFSSSSDSEVHSLLQSSDWKLSLAETRQILQQRAGREVLISL